MKHLAELHIGEGLEHYADEVHMRALVMQSNLDNTAIALSHIKNIAHTRLAPVDEDTQGDQETLDFVRKADALIMQIRSAKVIAGKATRQLEDLKARSLTLDPSTTITVEQVQRSTSELAASTQIIGGSIFKLLQEEDPDTPFTYKDISQAISPSEAQPLSPLSSQIHSTATQLQTFYSLTNSLTQIVEFSSPPPPPPWQLLAQNMRAATATSATHETEIGKLKDEMVEKDTALILREKDVEELSVQVEVLAKRVGESGGRREKVRELEGVIETARGKEQDLLSRLAHLQQNLRDLESEREAWKKAPQEQPLPAGPNAETSSSSLRQMQALKTEIAALQSSIRYLHTASHNQNISHSFSFLSAPLVPPSPAPCTTLQSEAADVLREMMHLATRPDNQVVRLKPTPREERLKWRPIRETSKWVVGRQVEEWEVWKEWRDGVAGKATRDGTGRAGGPTAREKNMQSAGGRGGTMVDASIIARVETRVKAGAGGAVRVVSPGEWEDVGHVLGLGGLGYGEGMPTLG